MDYSEVGLEIAFLRKEAALSQQAVADGIGVSRATLNALENGRSGDVGLRKIIKILDYLGYQLDVRVKSTWPSFEELQNE